MPLYIDISDRVISSRVSKMASDSGMIDVFMFRPEVENT